MTHEELYEVAEKARENSFAPFSKFRVGAAVLLKDGRVYTGVNIENSSYGATICAERTAFVKAISEGALKGDADGCPFEAIAVSAGEDEAVPCGICRQFMFEFAPEITVITKRAGELIARPLSRLLPEGFRL